MLVQLYFILLMCNRGYIRSQQNEELFSHIFRYKIIPDPFKDEKYINELFYLVNKSMTIDQIHFNIRNSVNNKERLN